MVVESGVEITPSQQDSIDKLKLRLANEIIPSQYDETFFLYRFLKARNFNLDDAESMIRKNLEWRRKNRIDFIVSEYDIPEILRIYFKHYHLGFDKSGSPFYYAQVGKYDIRGLHMAAKYSDIEKTILYVAEQAEKMLEETSKEKNTRLRGYLCIYDCEGLTFANATNKKGCETLIKLLKIPQENYPERMKAIFVINASSYFALLFSIVKSFINPGILSKIHVFGTDGWKEEVLKHIDTDQLPAFMGGTLTDPDGNPLCKTLVNTGIKVDEKYFITKTSRCLRGQPDVKKIVLARASFSEISLDVKEAGSVIEYEFETKTRDIGFGLFYSEMVNGEEKVTELVPLIRLETEEFSETGMYKCERAGKYIMLFDNSYSWVRSKEIYYLVKVRTPKEVEKSMQQ